MAKSETIFIGPGIAHYPAINRPDTKFDELGMYKASLILSADEAEPYIKKLQARAKAHMGKALPKAKNSLFEMVLDDEGDETGEVLFKISVKNKLNKQGKTWDRKPLVIDAKKNTMSDEISVWGGSTIKVQAEIYEWAFNSKKGISLQPIVVQVIDLKTGEGKADLSGFDEEEGYEDSDASSLSGFDNEGATSSSTDDDEDGDY